VTTARLLPGAAIGIFGGGQLGRMTGMAARAMGYDVHVFDPEPQCAAAAIATRVVTAPYDDEQAAARFAERCDVVTLEIEQVSVTTLNAAARFAPVRPSPDAIHVVQDRGRQKAWLQAHGFPLGPVRVCDDEEAFVDAVAALAPCVAKSAHGGYDGRGQERIADGDDGAARAAWQRLGGRRVVVEQFLDLAFEISVMTARAPDGHVATFPPSWNHHERGILTWSMSPAPIESALAAQAVELGRAVTDRLGLFGLLAVEMFVTKDGRLLVNELAPRPHNTFHQTERGNQVSQFEQHVRAVCNLPLGTPDAIRPAAIHNLLGDLWVQPGRTPNVLEAYGMPGVRVHLYGKGSARAGRKMGHLSATGDTPEMARDLVKAAYRSIARSVGLAD
jgi:5-(carboxyamino)imidazole ribonucleotide synthase